MFSAKSLPHTIDKTRQKCGRFANRKSPTTRFPFFIALPYKCCVATTNLLARNVEFRHIDEINGFSILRSTLCAKHVFAKSSALVSLSLYFSSLAQCTEYSPLSLCKFVCILAARIVSCPLSLFTEQTIRDKTFRKRM